MVQAPARTNDDGRLAKELATLAAQIASVAPIRADEIFEQAANAAMSLDEGAPRIEALATVALRKYPTDPDRAAGLFRLARRSISTSVAIRDTGSNALPTISRGIAAGCRSNPEAIGRAVRLARSISDQAIRAMALADVAEQVAPHDQASADRLFAETIDLMGDLGDSTWKLEEAAAEVAATAWNLRRLAQRSPVRWTLMPHPTGPSCSSCSSMVLRRCRGSQGVCGRQRLPGQAFDGVTFASASLRASASSMTVKIVTDSPIKIAPRTRATVSESPSQTTALASPKIGIRLTIMLAGAARTRAMA